MTTVRRRRSTRVAALGTAAFAAAALTLTACGEPERGDYQGVCVDKKTEKRLPDNDKRCEDDNDRSHGFVFFPTGSRYPAVGESFRSYSGAVSRVPAGHNGAYSGASAKGGTASRASVGRAISRGGFGSTGKGGSVGG